MYRYSTFLLYVLLGVGIVAFASCRGSGDLLSEKTADEIPWNSDLIIVDSEKSPDALYKALRAELDSRNFTVGEENESNRSVVTEPKSIGQRVVLEADGNVDAGDGGGSTLTLKGMVGDEQIDQAAQALTDAEGGSGEGERRAVWVRGGNQQRGFAVLVQIAQEMPGTVSYKEEE